MREEEMGSRGDVGPKEEPRTKRPRERMDQEETAKMAGLYRSQRSWGLGGNDQGLERVGGRVCRPGRLCNGYL